MAEAAGSGIGETEAAPRFDSQPGLGYVVSSHAELILSLVAHEEYLTDVDKYPESDVRDRFLRERCMRAQYVAWLVMVRRDACDELLRDVRMRKADPNDEEYLKRHDIVVRELDDALSWYSRVNKEDSEAANAPAVDPFFMNHYRRGLEKPGKGLRAPNGVLRSMYGAIGDPVPRSCFSLRHCDDDFFRRLILDKLMVPLNHNIYVPLQERYNTVLRRNGELQPHALSQRTLDILVMILECVVAVGCFAAPVTILYHLKSTRSRLIAAPFASFICLLPTIFLSREARNISTLLAGTWSVVIVMVFLSDATYTTMAG